MKCLLLLSQNLVFDKASINLKKSPSYISTAAVNLLYYNLFKHVRKLQWPTRQFNTFKLHEQAFLVKSSPYPHQILSFALIALEFLLQAIMPKRWLEVNTEHSGRGLNFCQ